MKRAAVAFILFFAFCGFLDSFYIARNEANNMPLFCNITGLSGCTIVAASQYSHFFGIPIAEYGMLFYASIFFAAVLELALFDRLLRRILQIISYVGIAASVYFTFLEVFVIHALCIYCVVSALITLLIFITASLLEPVKKVVQQV